LKIGCYSALRKGCRYRLWDTSLSGCRRRYLP